MVKHQYSPASMESHVRRKLTKSERKLGKKESSTLGRKEMSYKQTSGSFLDVDVGVSLSIYIDETCLDFLKSVARGVNTLHIVMSRSEACRYMLRMSMAYIRQLLDQEKDSQGTREIDKILSASLAKEI